MAARSRLRWARAIRAMPVIYTLHLAPITRKSDGQPAPTSAVTPSLDSPEILTRQLYFGFRGPQKFPSPPRVDLQSFEENELGGRPLFTREMIAKVIDFQDSGGLKDGSRLFWLRSYMNATKNTMGRKQGEYRYIPSIPGVMVLLPLKEGKAQPAPLDIAQLEGEVQELQRHWDQSQMCQQLQTLVHDCAKRGMPHINKIICFGLGSPSLAHGYQYPPEVNSDQANAAGRRSIVLQHLAATTIATALEQVYSSDLHPSTTVQIISQDPSYTPADKTLLSRLAFPIDTIEDPKGFLAIDRHTLVYHFCCPAPLNEICADLAISSDGPAAILGSEVDMDINMRDAQVYHWATPRVAKFLRDYEMKDFDDFEVPRRDWDTLWQGPVPPFLWCMQFWYKRVDSGGSS